MKTPVLVCTSVIFLKHHFHTYTSSTFLIISILKVKVKDEEGVPTTAFPIFEK